MRAAFRGPREIRIDEVPDPVVEPAAARNRGCRELIDNKEENVKIPVSQDMLVGGAS